MPLGVPLIQYEAPDGKPQRRKPLEERKTFRWIRGLRDCARMAAELGGTSLVSVMDREADVFALFAEQRQLGSVDQLVRAKCNRTQGPGRPKLFDSLRGQPAQGQLQIEVARSSARLSTRQQKAKPLVLR